MKILPFAPKTSMCGSASIRNFQKSGVAQEEKKK
jgi:hypothetical protein